MSRPLSCKQRPRRDGWGSGSRWWTLVLLLGLLPLFVACAGFGPGPSSAVWRGAWGTALFANVPSPEAAASAPPGWARPLQDVVLRQKVMLSAAGPALRVQISNAGGQQPLRLQAAQVALALPDAAATPAERDTQPPQAKEGSLHALRFAGQTTLTLAPGAFAWSDAVPLHAPRGAELLVDLHIASGAEPASLHPGSRIHSWSLPGAAAAQGDFSRATRQLGWWYLNAVDVQSAAPSGPVLVATGDSITDGYGVAPGSYQRWTDALQRRLQQAGLDAAVVNTGIGGNRLLRDGLGPSLVSRFERDALQRSGVSHVVLLIGVNDFGVQRREGQDTPAARAALLQALQAAWRDLAQRARAQGVCLLAATVLPYGASGYYKPAADNEADRLAFNRWLHEAGLFDGVVDFALLLQDPARPERLHASFDSGDGLHPSMAGYAEMARAFPIDKLSTPCPRR